MFCGKCKSCTFHVFVRSESMKNSEIAALRKYTETLMAKPICSAFLRPVDPRSQGLIDYEKIVTYPMDFGTVMRKLIGGSYSTPADWYTDVCAIFQNAIDYHPPELIIHKIAEYCLGDFKRSYHFTRFRTLEAWFQEYMQLYEELNKEIMNSPVKIGHDPLIDAVLKEAEAAPPPSTQMIPDLVEKLNKLSEKKTSPDDIIQILMQTQPDLSIPEGDAIDADQMNEKALSALLIYTTAHS